MHGHVLATLKRSCNTSIGLNDYLEIGSFRLKGYRIIDMAKKETSALLALAMTLCVITLIAGGSFVAIKHFDVPLRIKRMFQGSHMYPELPGVNTPVSRIPDETIETAQLAKLNHWFENEQFDRLNRALDQYQKEYEHNYKREFAVKDAYQIFESTPSQYEKLLKKWINDYPQHYQPYLAAAHFHYSKGWDSRGEDTRKNTTDEQFEGMYHNHAIAKERLHSALNINQRLLLAHNILIGIENTGGSDGDEHRAVKNAITSFPRSYIIRATAMWAYQPRWGGSYQQMREVASDAQIHADQYPVLTALFGHIYRERSYTYRINDEHENALEMINKAIAFGDRCEFYYDRSKIYAYDLKNYDKALEDITYAIHLRPTIFGHHYEHLKHCFATKAYDKAIEQVETIKAIWQDSSQTDKWCSWAAAELNHRGMQIFKTKPNQALELFNTSLLFKPNNPETLRWIGYTQLGAKKTESGIDSLINSIEHDPRNFNHLSTAIMILRTKGQSDTALKHLNAFLELEPNHADALVMRSTFFINSDRERCLADLQKACTLGNEKACKSYQRLNKGRTK